jgi:Flp pilus assembly protein TadD
MSRKPLLLAAVAAMTLAFAGQAQAWPFSKKDDAKAAAQPAQANGQAATQPTTQAAARPPASLPRKSTPAERIQAERLEPLARASFWSQEVDVDRTDAEAGIKLSQALRAIGRNDEAAAAADNVLIVHPDNVEALLELARDHLARGQGFYAVDPLQRAAAKTPRDWRPQSLLGVAYEQVSRHADAQAAWAKALTLSPDNPSVLSNMAMSYVATGEPAKAEALLRRAVTQPTATVQTRQNLALVLGLQGKAAEAEQMIRTNLPPELAEQDLAWLRSRAPVTGAPVAGAAPAQAAPTRTWGSVQGSPGGDQ